jgi:hypothetical protein
MIDLRRQPEETPAEWLARLEKVEPRGLPTHTRRALTLSIGYARHLTVKDGVARRLREAVAGTLVWQGGWCAEFRG